MKEQKRLGNKGFSLVELIVVIAIMAILVAVLAPTLLSKIEDSREGTDLQALGEINTAIKEAILSSEKANEEMPDGKYTVTVPSGGGAPTISGGSIPATNSKVDAELKRTIPEVKFKSKLAKDADVKIEVEVKTGTVTTRLIKSNNVVNMSNGEPFEVK